MLVERRMLAVYLNDHLAGATAALELARRSAGANSGSPLGDFLDGLGDEIEEDKAVLEQIMDELGIGRDRVKQAVGWGAEKLGRLKLNGRLLGYSPLSRLLELEALHIGVASKLGLWQSLSIALGASLAKLELESLIDRAERQFAELAEHRALAAAEAFAGEPAAG